MYMHCSNCGNSLEAVSKFCGNCGTPADNNSIPVESQSTYSFVVTGEIVEGQTLDSVKDNLEKFIKLDRKTLDGIFAKRDFVIKKDIDKETAEKYKKAFSKCGAICKITENATNIITNDKSPGSSSLPHQTKGNLSEADDSENYSESATDKENHSIKGRNIITKYSLKENEHLFMEGYVVYLKSKINVVQGDAYLTSERFVYCKKSTVLFYLVLGPLFGHLVKGKDLVFEIPLCDLKSIHEEKHGLGKKIVLTSSSGGVHAIAFGTRKEKWLKAIKEAVANSVPNSTVSEIGERIDFSLA